MIIQLLEYLFDTDTAYSYLGLPAFIAIFWAIAILFIGRWFARRSRNWFRSAINKTDIKANKKLVHVVEDIIYYGILLLAVTMAMAAIGIPIDVLVTIIAVVVILMAIALQTSLANLAATIIFLVFQTFKAGDWVDVTNGTFGKVKEIQMFTTVLVTQEQSTVTIPNGVILKQNIINYSDLGYRRVDLIITVTYQDDLLKAKQIIEQILAENSYVLAEPKPVVGVQELGDKGVNFSVRPFAKANEYWDAKFAITEEIKLRLDEAGIKIPITQQDVHLIQAN